MRELGLSIDHAPQLREVSVEALDRVPLITRPDNYAEDSQSFEFVIDFAKHEFVTCNILKYFAKLFASHFPVRITILLHKVVKMLRKLRSASR